MGCWNHTCAVTHLPIIAGEPVEVILLKASTNTEENSYCHADAYHSPIPLTFGGIYDDYGGVEECSGVALPLLVETLKKNLFEMEVGENKYHDIAAKKDEFDIDKLFELDHEQRLFIVNPQKWEYDMREAVQIKHIVVRKTVYDEIVRGVTFESWKAGFKRIGYAELLAEIPQFTADLDEMISQKDPLKRMLLMMNDQVGDTVLGAILAHRGEGTYGMNKPINTTQLLASMRENKDPDFDAMLINALDMSQFMTIFEHGRRSWNVPSGAGSQNEDTSYHEMVARLTLSEAELIKNRWDDEE